MALTKIKLDSMVTGTLPDANIPDDITITGLSGTNSGDQTTGISDGNILECNANVADNDFLRIDGTEVEGRTASEVLSDIGAQASGSYITGSGSLSAQDLTDIGNLSNTNTGDQTLPTDFVSAASGGTFSGNVGIGIASSGATANTSINQLVIENDDSVGISILSPNTSSGYIAFGDPQDDIAGGIQYDHNADDFKILGKGDTSVMMTIDSSGNVGIGGSPSTDLYVLRTDSDSEILASVTGPYFPRLQLERTGGDPKINRKWSFDIGTNGSLFVEDKTGGTSVMEFDTSNDVTVTTGDLVIGTAGKGIDFSNQSPSSATGATTGDEVLDHYEEGTWTPTFAGSGSAGSSTTVQRHTATYTKIGRSVTASCYISWTDQGTYSGSVSITGLPFTCLSTLHAVNIAYMEKIDFTTSRQLFGYVGGASVQFLEAVDDGNPAMLPISAFDDALNYFSFQVTYQTT
jgi:hypothetical protein